MNKIQYVSIFVNAGGRIEDVQIGSSASAVKGDIVTRYWKIFNFDDHGWLVAEDSNIGHLPAYTQEGEYYGYFSIWEVIS